MVICKPEKKEKDKMEKNIPSKGWKAGAAKVDISPEKGIQLAGDVGRLRPVEEIVDPLFAKAVAVEHSGKRACIVQMDLTIITKRFSDEIKREAKRRYGLSPESVMLHATQTHSTPSLGHEAISEDYRGLPPELWYLRGSDERYFPVAVKGIIESIGKAIENLEPDTIMAGRGVDGRVSFNRRFVMRDGTVKSHPGRFNSDILHSEGPIDPEVGVVLFANVKSERIAALLHHTCHPVHGYNKRAVTAGWPGAWASAVQKTLGQKCVALVINGFCGNIHHHNHLDPWHVDNYTEMGNKLADTARRVVMEKMVPVDSGSLSCKLRILKLARRNLEKKTVEEAHELLRKYPSPIWEDSGKTNIEWRWVYAHSRIDMSERFAKEPYYGCPVQVIRIGDIALVGVPGEPFVEEQLRIKLESPAPFTFCAHMTNDSAGYIPTAQAFKKGGFETETANWSCLAPDSLKLIGDCAVETLKKLYSV